MSHGRPARVERYTRSLNVLQSVVLRVTLLTADELATSMTPVRRCLTALREGVATEAQWIELASAVEISLAIEDRGVVRGIRGHIKHAEASLLIIHLRAMRSGTWQAMVPDFDELENVTELVELLAYQLKKLTAAEVNDAFKLATGRVISDGGRMFKADHPVGPGVAVAVPA